MPGLVSRAYCGRSCSSSSRASIHSEDLDVSYTSKAAPCLPWTLQVRKPGEGVASRPPSALTRENLKELAGRVKASSSTTASAKTVSSAKTASSAATARDSLDRPMQVEAFDRALAKQLRGRSISAARSKRPQSSSSVDKLSRSSHRFGHSKHGAGSREKASAEIEARAKHVANLVTRIRDKVAVGAKERRQRDKKEEHAQHRLSSVELEERAKQLAGVASAQAALADLLYLQNQRQHTASPASFSSESALQDAIERNQMIARDLLKGVVAGARPGSALTSSKASSQRRSGGSQSVPRGAPKAMATRAVKRADSKASRSEASQAPSAPSDVSKYSPSICTASSLAQSEASMSGEPSSIVPELMAMIASKAQSEDCISQVSTSAGRSEIRASNADSASLYSSSASGSSSCQRPRSADVYGGSSSSSTAASSSRKRPSSAGSSREISSVPTEEVLAELAQRRQHISPISNRSEQVSEASPELLQSGPPDSTRDPPWATPFPCQFEANNTLTRSPNDDVSESARPSSAPGRACSSSSPCAASSIVSPPWAAPFSSDAAAKGPTSDALCGTARPSDIKRLRASRSTPKLKSRAKLSGGTVIAHGSAATALRSRSSSDLRHRSSGQDRKQAARPSSAIGRQRTSGEPGPGSVGYWRLKESFV